MLLLQNVEISSNIPLMLATADLKMIQSVLNAMDIADLASAHHSQDDLPGARSLTASVDCLELTPTRVQHSGDPVREIYHAAPKGVANETGGITGHDCTLLWDAELGSSTPSAATSGIQPPWDAQLWKETPKLDVGQTVKFMIHPPDHPIKGRLIDLFG